MDIEQVREQAQVGGWAKVEGRWLRILRVHGDASNRPVDVDRRVVVRGRPRVEYIAAIAPPSERPPDCGPAVSMFDLAEQVARWPNPEDADNVLYDFAVAARRVLLERDLAVDLLRDGSKP